MQVYLRSSHVVHRIILFMLHEQTIRYEQMHYEEQLLEQITANLPKPLTIENATWGKRDNNHDGLLTIGTPDGQLFTFAFEMKKRLRKEALLQWRSTLENHSFPYPGLLVCGAVTPALEDYCIENQINFIDSGGNASISVPGLFIHVSGRKVADLLNETPRISEGVMKLLFVLLSAPELIDDTYRQLASYAGISLGMVSKAFDYLELERHYRISKSGRRLINTDKIIELWVREYATTLRPKLKTLRLECTDRWQDIPLKTGEYWGGEAAANMLSYGYLQPEVLQLFSPYPLSDRKTSLGLRSRPNGNLLLTSTFWGEHFTLPERAIVLLSIAELIATQDDRNIETAGMLNERYLHLKTATLFGH